MVFLPAKRGGGLLYLVVVRLVEGRLADPLVADHAFAVDDEDGALGGDVALHTGQSGQGHTVGVDRRAVKVAEQREVEVVLVGPGLQGEGPVDADAVNRGVDGVEGVGTVAEAAHLGGADAGERTGEEGQDHGLAAMVRQVANLPVEVIEAEFRGRLSNIGWHYFSSESFGVASSYHNDATSQAGVAPGRYDKLRGITRQESKGAGVKSTFPIESLTMTSRSASAKAPKGGEYDHLEPLPDPPRELDMEQWQSATSFDAMLEAHFANRSDVLISGAGYLRQDPANEMEQFAPDCVVTFGVNPDAIVVRNGYVISEVGKPPDFVLEVASRSTGRRDYTVKRDGYAAYGVLEYWRFDRTGGRFHDAALAGDVLTGEQYTPVSINRDPDGLIWGHSQMLGLDLCWDNGTLKLRDPATGRFLPTPQELQFEVQAAQNRAETAEARAAALEAELRRLRGQ